MRTSVRATQAMPITGGPCWLHESEALMGPSLGLSQEPSRNLLSPQRIMRGLRLVDGIRGQLCTDAAESAISSGSLVQSEPSTATAELIAQPTTPICTPPIRA